MIENVLRKLDFSEKEIKIYALILKHPGITPSELARISKINRTTVYAVAKSLIRKGIVAEDVGSKSFRLAPVSASELNKLNRREEDEFKARTSAISQLAEELALAKIGAEYVVPKIRFVEDADVEDYLYDNLKKWLESTQKYDSTWWGFQDHLLVENYKKWIDWSWQHSPASVQLKLLSNRSQIEERLKGKYAKRHIKFWNKSNSFTGSIWILGDYIVTLVTGEKPFHLIETRDEVMAHNLREMFKSLWEIA